MLQNLSLRSKLIIAFLGVSLLAAAVVIGLGYWSGVNSISDEVYSRLRSVRNAKSFEIEEYFDQEAKITESLAASEEAAVAIVEFTNGLRTIAAEDTISCTRALEDYYQDFLTDLGQVLEVRRDIDAYYPRSVAACYLQYQYIAKVEDAERRSFINNAGDGSNYSSTHERYHPYYREMVEKFGFYDIFLIDAQTRTIVYSAMKESDYATSLADGPYRNSNLATLVEKTLRNDDIREAQVADFDFYRPSFGRSAAFMSAPVFYRGELVGVLAIQLSIDKLNNIMNYGREWAENGLGETGEVLLVGDDYYLRSDTRQYLTEPAAFQARMAKMNLSDEQTTMLRAMGPILVTELNTENITRALRGEVGITELIGYHGQEVLSAFTPLELPGGLKWALVAEIDKDEALAPVSRFQLLNLSALVAIIAIVTLLAMYITRAFIKPIDRLTEGARAVSRGDTDTRVEKISDDEMGQLTDVFNSMVASIDAQKQEIAAQAEENNALLFSRFPDAIAERYRAGEVNIVDNFEGVAVLSVDIRGTTAFAEMADDQAWAIVQEISRRFEQVSRDLGMEVIHPIPDGYLVVCGMNIPRLDNGRRIAILALDLRKVIEEINAKHELELSMNAGMAHGPVLAGILEDETRNYVVWGDTVDQAQRLAYQSRSNRSYGTQPLMDLLAGNFHFDEVITVEASERQTIRAGVLRGRVTDLQKAGKLPKA